MKIGVAYYPEHWPPERWPVDARLMRETGIDLVRMGEFAWSRMEPRRAQYDLDWLERAIEVLAAEGLKVIMCTPTAAPPAWLFHRHPSMPAQDREGRNWYRGSRRVICLNNRPYRRYVGRILRELARRFARNPHVFAWQIDNEIGSHGSGRCYCDDCEQAFRQWLHRRYGTIDRLNKLWGTAFWSQEFADWHLIPAPRRTPAQPHPSLVLDYQRFISATVRDFLAEQRQQIANYAGGDARVTTNTLGLRTDQLDQFSLAVPQDVVSVDNYPTGPQGLDRAALDLDLTRSAKRQLFWVLEQKAGATLMRSDRRQPQLGQLRLWSFQAAARGAGLIEYFRWRTCAFAQEMHRDGMLEPDGNTSRRYEELKATIAELKEHAPLWEGRMPRPEAAVVLDYHSCWALRSDALAAGLDYLAQLRALYSGLRRLGVTVDIVQPEDPVEAYRMLIAPMPMIGREKAARRWTDLAEKGGCVLVTAPAGYRTEYNTWAAGPLPGAYAALLGVRCPEHDILGGNAKGALLWDDRSFPVNSYCAAIDLDGADAMARYADEAYDGLPAVTRNPCGEGSAWFLGALSNTDLYDVLLRAVAQDAGVPPHPWSSEFVEVVPLAADDGQKSLTFVMNHSGEPVELQLEEGRQARDILAGLDLSGAVRLERFGVALIEG